jgi:exodeoxyribonuclease V beta subunit
MKKIKNTTLVLKASAGTGKTFALTVRYISLLLLGAKPYEILALTFTNKAALQMNQKIFESLQALGKNQDILDAISVQTNLTNDEILSQKDNLMALMLNDETSIFTIDKFVNKILREFSGYSDISEGFEIRSDDLDMLGALFLKSLDEKSFNSLLEFSHYSQKQFVSLLEMFKLLIVQNEKISYEYMTKEALEGAKELVFKKALIIKEYVFTHEKSTPSAKKAVSFTTIQDILNSTWATKDEFQGFKSFTKAIQSEYINSVFLELKEAIKTYFYISSNYNLRILDEIFIQFKEFKLNYQKRDNYLEFTDIANLAYKLLSTTLKDNMDFLYFRLDAKYSHILIDEFQDTSLLQYKILKPLIDEIFAGEGTSYKTFFYVGDIKQSIYRFRGGKSDLFDYLVNQYKDDGLVVENLSTNYRSRQNIVEFVNNIFVPLPSYDMVTQSYKKDGGLVEIIEVEDDFGKDKEYKEILNTVVKLQENNIPLENIAILTYTNADVLNILHYLKSNIKNINISTDMTSKLIDVSSVKAIVNYIKYLYFNEEIYKENFNSLLGIQLKTKLQINLNLKTNNLRDIVYECAKYYDIFDDNVIKFLSIIDIYDDVVDFIYNIHNDETTIVNKNTNGLTILTVFKSKGLEFDTVLLLDRIKAKNSDKSSLLFEYDEVNLKQIHYKIKNKEYFDIDYITALKKEKELVYLDELNILYVALTRAENNLFIFKKRIKPNSKAINIFNLVAFSDNSIKKGELVISENKNQNIKEDTKPLEYQALSLGSQNIAKRQDDTNYTLYAQYFGIATHYCLEMLIKFDIVNLDRSILQTRARYSNYLDDNDFKKIYVICKNLINHKQFQEQINGYEIVTEQALSYNGEIKILDLMCVKDDEIIIYDYKTTTLQQSNHNTQVLHYQKALNDIFPNHKVSGKLIYLSLENISIVDV